ncbi:MAG: sensor histidine kinase [Xanthobacteraceae bacterium]
MLGTEERLNLALDRQQMLTGEMSHRIKNLFAITRGMIGVSVRDASTPAEVFNNFTGRLDALAVAHDLVRPSFDHEGVSVQCADLGDLVRTIARPHEIGAKHPEQSRFIIEGPPIPLGNHATNGLALLLYELATNAAKYGSLIDEGSVEVSWWNTDGRMFLNWLERGGPVIEAPPKRTGFGTKLVQNTVIGQLRGELSFDWRLEGLAVTMSVPIENLAN